MKNSQGGFIKWIIIIIIALVILGYYGFDVKKAFEAPTTQSNLNFAQEIVSKIWNNFLKVPVTYLFNTIVSAVLKSFIHN